MFRLHMPRYVGAVPAGIVALGAVPFFCPRGFYKFATELQHLSVHLEKWRRLDNTVGFVKSPNVRSKGVFGGAFLSAVLTPNRVMELKVFDRDMLGDVRLVLATVKTLATLPLCETFLIHDFNNSLVHQLFR